MGPPARFGGDPPAYGVLYGTPTGGTPYRVCRYIAHYSCLWRPKVHQSGHGTVAVWRSLRGLSAGQGLVCRSGIIPAGASDYRSG